ncbi:hypothetical protein, partial [Thermacetogenium phaeum]|uniref:hypothetical protein n=1 Tax=Thermacetogenium phaeum TaxID=85874 RepID=UPI001B7FE1E1
IASPAMEQEALHGGAEHGLFSSREDARGHRSGEGGRPSGEGPFRCQKLEERLRSQSGDRTTSPEGDLKYITSPCVTQSRSRRGRLRS